MCPFGLTDWLPLGRVFFPPPGYRVREKRGKILWEREKFSEESLPLCRKKRFSFVWKETFFVKGYHRSSLRFWTSLFGFPSPFSQVWNAHLLLQRGVRTPLPIAAIAFLKEHTFYLVFPYLKGAVSVGEEHLEKLVKWMVYLHHQGIFHGDFKPPNVLLWQGEFSLLDLDQLRLKSTFSPNLAAKDWCSLFRYFSSLYGEKGKKLWELYWQFFPKRQRETCVQRLLLRLRKKGALPPPWL